MSEWDFNYRYYKHWVLQRVAHDDRKYKQVRNLLCVISCLDIYIQEEKIEKSKEQMIRDFKNVQRQIEDIIKE